MMMNDKKKAKILATCLEAIESGDAEKKDRMLLQYSDLAGEINDLIVQAGVLNRLPDFEMDEVSLRSRKIALLAKLPSRDFAVTKTRPFRLNKQKTEWRFTMTWIVIVATIVSLMSGAGVVYASGDALPGDTLYPVKILMEDAQLALSPDSVDTGLRMRFADHRVSELVELLEEARIDDMDQALTGYQNQTELLTRLISKIEANYPEEAVRLRAELQSKLQEQAMMMQQVMERVNAGSGEMVQEKIQTMLQTNTELRTRMQQNAEPSDSGDVNTETDSVVPLEEQQIDEKNGQGNGQGNGEQTDQSQNSQPGNGIALAGEYLEDDQLRLIFSGEALENQSYYLEMGGMRQDCTVGNGVITCIMNQSMQQGTATLYDKNTNTLLFQYTFDHSNQIQKGRPESDNMGEGMNDESQGQNGKK